MLYKISAFFCTVAIVLFFLITSIEAVLYWDKDYFQKEYEKHHIAASIGMDTEDLMLVTEKMMEYLKDKQENLNMKAMIQGEVREVFNEKEKAHMEDVKALFLSAIRIRRVSIGVIMVCCALFLKNKRMDKFFRWIRLGILLTIGWGIVLAGVISINFFQAFQVFHKIFFRNQLWILDPKTDILINIVPQPFFVDTAIRIGVVFVLASAGLWCICTYLLRRTKKTGV